MLRSMTRTIGVPMAILVHASLAEVQSAIDSEPLLEPVAATLKLRQMTLPPPRRSLENLPSIVTVVDFLATALATNIAYDVAKSLVLGALARRFGKDKVEEVDDAPEPSASEDGKPS
jgi:hypothetical protein